MKKINKGQEIKHTFGFMVLTLNNIGFYNRERIIDINNGSSANVALIDKEQIILDNIKEYGKGFKRGHKIIGLSTKTKAKIKRVE